MSDEEDREAEAKESSEENDAEGHGFRLKGKKGEDYLPPAERAASENEGDSEGDDVEGHYKRH